jgi:hypothetical protein
MATTNISSAVSSVAAGIVEAKSWGDPHVLKEAAKSFQKTEVDSFSPAAVEKFKETPVAQQAAISSPSQYYKDLPAVQSGAVNTKELHSKLENPKMDLKQGIDGLKNTFEDEIKKWEEKLNGLGDDAQLANVDLQNILQKQQKTLQMMSNISKMLFDTSSSVIRKMGG